MPWNWPTVTSNFFGGLWVRVITSLLAAMVALPTGAILRCSSIDNMNSLIKETLSLLHELRGDLECDGNARAIQQIDVMIENLEELKDQHHSEEKLKQLCLQALGKAIRHLPLIARILESMDK